MPSLKVVGHGDEGGDHAGGVGGGLGLGGERREDEGQHDEREAAELHHGEGHEDVRVGDDHGDGEDRHYHDHDGHRDAVHGEPRQPGVDCVPVERRTLRLNIAGLPMVRVRIHEGGPGE